MRYYVEGSLSNFKFWCGGKDRAELLNSDQLDSVEELLEEMMPEDGWSDTDINDFFWFEFDTIANWLGYKDEEYLKKGVSNDDIQEAEDWFEELGQEYEFFDLAKLNIKSYIFINDDGEEEFDYDKAHEDFEDWWNEKDDFEKVGIYQHYN